MKKITLIQLLFALVFFLVSSVAIAATLHTSTNIDHLKVASSTSNNDWAGWKKSITVTPSTEMQLDFQVHYYANGGDVDDIKLFLEDLRGKTFPAGVKVVTSSGISDNTPSIAGSVPVTFTQPAKLEYSHYTFQENACNSPSCETSGNSSATSFFGSGFKVGDKKQDKYGNLIISFRALPAAAQNCSVNGTTVNDGTSRVFYSQATVPYGQSCASITRACNNGTLTGSGSYIYTSCSVQNQTTNPNLDPIVFTNSPTNITSNSGQFNSVFDDVSGYGQCYFNWGTSQSVPNTTFSQDINLNTTKNCQFIKKNLQPETTYYYRVVLDQNGQKKYGELKSFRTGKGVSAPAPAPVVVAPAPVVQAPVSSNKVMYSEVSASKLQTFSSTKWATVNGQRSNTTTVDASPGDDIVYNIEVRNNTSKDANNIIVSDTLSRYLDFPGQKRSGESFDRVLLWKIPYISAGDSRIISYTVTPRDDVPSGRRIITAANINSSVLKYNTNDVVVNILEESRNTTAYVDRDDSAYTTTSENMNKNEGVSMLTWFLRLLMAIFLGFLLWFIYKIFMGVKHRQDQRDYLRREEERKIREMMDQNK